MVPRFHITDRLATHLDSLPAAHEYYAAACGGDSAADGKLPSGARADFDDREHLLARDSIGGRESGGGAGSCVELDYFGITESSNGRMRAEYLNGELFNTMNEV